MSEAREEEARGSPSPPEDRTEKKPSARKALLKLILKLGIVGALGWAALTFVFGVYRVSGNSMYPALKDGDLCVTYRLEAYHTDDVVVYRAGGEVHFGRIVARATETVDGDGQGLLINGVHRAEEIFYPTEMLDTVLDLPVRLDDGQYLLLNDHRTELTDSRLWGLIDESDLEGKVIFFFRRRGF